MIKRVIPVEFSSPYFDYVNESYSTRELHVSGIVYSNIDCCNISFRMSLFFDEGGGLVRARLLHDTLRQDLDYDDFYDTMEIYEQRLDSSIALRHYLIGALDVISNRMLQYTYERERSLECPPIEHTPANIH